MTKLICHLLLLQFVWWSTVLSSVHLPSLPILCGLWLPFFIGLMFLKLEYQPLDFLAAIVLSLAGIVLDSLWIWLGYIEHQAQWPVPGLVPLWLLVLWFTVGFDFRYSLLWISERPVIGGLIAGASGPSSYWGGAALGIAIIPEQTAWLFGGGLFVTWAILFPVFARWLHNKADSPSV